MIDHTCSCNWQNDNPKWNTTRNSQEHFSCSKIFFPKSTEGKKIQQPRIHEARTSVLESEKCEECQECQECQEYQESQEYQECQECQECQEYQEYQEYQECRR